MTLHASINEPRDGEAILRDPRWPRIVARDKRADGEFWYSVATTGVYCRPSCPSRAALPKNVTIHDTLAGAKATGFRPCRRCNPDGLSLQAEYAALVTKACRMIDAAEAAPSLARLADDVLTRIPLLRRIGSNFELIAQKG